jgi:hypothetical protein
MKKSEVENFVTGSLYALSRITIITISDPEAVVNPPYPRAFYGIPTLTLVKGKIL